MAGALTHTSPGATSAPWSVIAPILGIVFVTFLVIGLAIPVLPLHVHEGLGLGTFAVGLVSGSQFVASLVSRPWAGGYADRYGGKRAVVVGLMAAAGAGLIYLLSLQLTVTVTPILSAAFLLAGRAALGGAESCIITGALSWALALVDSRHTGKVIAWVGTAMFAAFAAGEVDDSQLAVCAPSCGRLSASKNHAPTRGSLDKRSPSIEFSLSFGFLDWRQTGRLSRAHSEVRHAC